MKTSAGMLHRGFLACCTTVLMTGLAGCGSDNQPSSSSPGSSDSRLPPGTAPTGAASTGADSAPVSSGCTDGAITIDTSPYTGPNPPIDEARELVRDRLPESFKAPDGRYAWEVYFEEIDYSKLTPDAVEWTSANLCRTGAWNFTVGFDSDPTPEDHPKTILENTIASMLAVCYGASLYPDSVTAEKRDVILHTCPQVLNEK